jgi:hypothetical protein
VFDFLSVDDDDEDGDEDADEETLPFRSSLFIFLIPFVHLFLFLLCSALF